MNYRDIFSEEDLRKAVATYYSTNDFEIVSNDLDKAGDKLIGFLGDHLRMKVQIKLKGKLMDVPLFIKTIPLNNDSLVEYISQNFFYQKELSMYKDVLSRFSGHEEPSPWKIKALNVTEKFFIFEDVSARGFSPANQREYLTLKQCYAVIRSLAKLHATSVLFERKRTKELGRKFDMNTDCPIFTSPNNFSTAPQQMVWMDCGIRSLVKYVGEISQKYGRNSIHFEKVAEGIPKLFHKACDLLEPSDKYVNVLVHTDLWPGNFLFRSSKGTEEIDVILIDYQCLKYAPGTIDLGAFLCLSVDRKLRDENEENFLRFYRDIFNNETMNDEYPNEILSWQEIKESYDQSRLFGYLIATSLYPYILLESDVADKTYNKTDNFDLYNNIDRSEPMIDLSLSDKVFGKRLLQISEEFIERYIIN